LKTRKLASNYKILILFSEKRIDSLRKHYGELKVPITLRWEELQIRLKDDDMFQEVEPLEQIT